MIAAQIGLTSRTFFNLPAWIAQQKGFFTDEGLDVQLQLFQNGDDSREALRAGDIQIAFAAPEGALIDAYVTGGPLRVIAGNARRLPHFLIAQPRFKTLGDLRGANFGVISLKEGTTYIVPSIARAAGLKPGEYTVSAVGGAPKRWELLQRGEIDVGLQPFPLSYQAEEAGFSNLGWTGEFEPDWQFTAINANTDWTSRHRETTVALLRALQRGSDVMRDDVDEAARIGAEEMNASVALTRRSLEDDQRLGTLDPNLDWSEAGLARVFAVLQESGVIPSDQSFDISRVVDPSYLDASRRPAPASAPVSA